MNKPKCTSCKLHQSNNNLGSEDHCYIFDVWDSEYICTRNYTPFPSVATAEDDLKDNQL